MEIVLENRFSENRFLGDRSGEKVIIEVPKSHFFEDLLDLPWPIIAIMGCQLCPAFVIGLPATTMITATDTKHNHLTLHLRSLTAYLPESACRSLTAKVCRTVTAQ